MNLVVEVAPQNQLGQIDRPPSAQVEVAVRELFLTEGVDSSHLLLAEAAKLLDGSLTVHPVRITGGNDYAFRYWSTVQPLEEPAIRVYEVFQHVCEAQQVGAVPPVPVWGLNLLESL